MTDLYYNRAFIPDFDAIMAETAARSRAFVKGRDLRADIAYGPTPRQTYDLILPDRPRQGAPIHMFIHGGYWRAGEKDVHHLVAAPVLAAGGIAAIVTYDLMPATRLGAIVAQLRRAALQIQAQAAAFGADPARFTASGHSAGAHLASLLAARARGDLQPPSLPDLRGLLLASGIYDLGGIPGSFLKNEAAMTTEEAALWAPRDAVHRPDLPRILTRGEAETAPFHDQAHELASLLPAPCVLRVEPGLNHLSLVLDLADPMRPLGAALADLVANS
ncbi:alpha/beta hydrolase [Gemmobacter serpentinus]|uniref:alpha/beta hydrolase n=1 Tax=Gemmobacter serpentinus TaxID=2652247 RepID=UPI00124E51AA|nr:alpha/beta hydrolase [Gemmobacter serpentinus]